MRKLNINIALGSNPAIDPQINNPRLMNGYVTAANHLGLLPALTQQFDLSDSIFYLASSYKNRTIVAAGSNIYYIENGILESVAVLSGNFSFVRMSENTQNEVCIVNDICRAPAKKSRH